MNTILFALILALIAIILIVAVFKLAMRQREKELVLKETILDKEH